MIHITPTSHEVSKVPVDEQRLAVVILGRESWWVNLVQQSTMFSTHIIINLASQAGYCMEVWDGLSCSGLNPRGLSLLLNPCFVQNILGIWMICRVWDPTFKTGSSWLAVLGSWNPWMPSFRWNLTQVPHPSQEGHSLVNYHGLEILVGIYCSTCCLCVFCNFARFYVVVPLDD